MYSNKKKSSFSQPNFIPAHQGWCFKQGSFFKTWKKRWLALKGNTITYFIAPDGKAKGFISLVDCNVELDTKKKSTFLITSPKKTYRFTTSTEEEANSWIDAILIAIGQKKPKIGIEDFDILKVLGRGSCGKVQLVRFKQNNQLYALKSLSKAKLEKINLVCQTLTEKDALLSINHPFIVSARYTFQTNTKVFMVLDYAAGGELLKQLEAENNNYKQTGSLVSEDDRKTASQFESYSYDESEESETEIKIEKCKKVENPIRFNANIGIHNCIPISQYEKNNYGGFPLERVRIYAAEIAQAIKYMHSIGIIHRDLKPANILLDKDGHIKLTDFGLVKEKMFGKCAKTSTFCGTPLYAAPEIILRKPYGRSVDWWSFGVIIYELIFYDPPFYSENINDLCQQIIGTELHFPSQFIIEGQKFEDSNKNNSVQNLDTKKIIPYAVYDFLSKILEKNPMRRLGSNSEDDIFNHPFFDGISWDSILNKSIEMPWKPKLKNDDDVSFFYEQYTGEEALISIEDPSIITKETNEAFANFSYINDDTVLDCL